MCSPTLYLSPCQTRCLRAYVCRYVFNLCTESLVKRREECITAKKKPIFLILQRIVVSCNLVHFEIISLTARIRKEFSMIWNILWGLTKFALLWTEYREILIYKKNRKLWCWRISGTSYGLFWWVLKNGWEVDTLVFIDFWESDSRVW